MGERVVGVWMMISSIEGLGGWMGWREGGVGERCIFGISCYGMCIRIVHCFEPKWIFLTDYATPSLTPYTSPPAPATQARIP